MNRDDEILDLINEADALDVPSGGMTRALKRKKRNSLIVRPLATLASIFALFVLVINVSPTVAQALEGIPVLGGMTRALRFSPSTVKDAVKSDYFQPLDLTATDGGVTLNVGYLIADENNVKVIFSTKSDKYKRMFVFCRYGDGEDSVRLYCDNENNWEWTASSRLFSGDNKYPESGALNFEVYEYNELIDKWLDVPDSIPLDSISESTGLKPVAKFSFDIAVDKERIQAPKHYDLNRTLDLEGQTVTLTSIDMYPTCTAINVERGKDNSAEIRSMGFGEFTDDRMHHYKMIPTVEEEYFYPYPSDRGYNYDFSGDTATFYVESLYFSETESLTFASISCSIRTERDIEIDLAAGELAKPSNAATVLEAKKDGKRVSVILKIPYEADLVYDSHLSDVGGFFLWGEDQYSTFGIEDVEAPENYEKYWREYENGDNVKWEEYDGSLFERCVYNVVAYASDDYDGDTITFEFDRTGYVGDKVTLELGSAS